MSHNTIKSAQNKTREVTLLSRFIIFFISFFCFVIGLFSPTSHANTETTSFYQNFDKLSFKNQKNQPFSVSQLDHKVVLFNFIYTQCASVCSLQTKTLAEIYNSLPSSVKSKVSFVSVSLDPLNDTPSKLKMYAKKNHADINNWSFITGKPNDVATLSDRLKLYGVDQKKRDLAVRPNDHTTHIWLIDAKGQVMMRYMGDPMDKTRIAREIAQLTEY
jgi:cytochrome oxidase Cu insertion factor (SCO1/SenC/PrrC family)